MKLIKTKLEKIRQDEDHGFFKLTVEHEIKQTSAAAEYNGPKITPEVWWPVCSFFRWVNKETHSEAQVRLYVNARESRWEAWAFPQEARTGMSAKEIDSKEAREQRQRYKESEGWIYFGTIHSHCSSSAFQSSTDESNETGQDGLHITVGHIDKPQLDIHSRFYRKRMMFEPDLSQFWQTDDILQGVPDAVRKYLRATSLHEMAKDQMSEFTEAEFPQQWKDNLIEIKQATTTHAIVGMGVHTGGSFNQGAQHTTYNRTWKDRMNDSVQQIFSQAIKKEMLAELCERVDELEMDEAFGLIVDTCHRNRLDAQDLGKVIVDLADKMEAMIQRNAGKIVGEQVEEDAIEDEIGNMNLNGGICTHNTPAGSWCNECMAWIEGETWG